MVPRVEVTVAPVRFISGQNSDTENRRWIAARPPYTSGPSTAVTMAFKWKSARGGHGLGVAVVAQAALGRPRGPAGVDERGQVRGPDVHRRRGLGRRQQLLPAGVVDHH